MDDFTRQKIRDGIARRRAKGLPWGRPKGKPLSDAERLAHCRPHALDTKGKISATMHRKWRERKEIQP